MANGEGRRATNTGPTPAEERTPDVVVDARGFYCPIPILRLAKAFKSSAPGSVARLLATDPVSIEDVEVFCRERSYKLLHQRLEEGVYLFDVKKKP